MAAVGFTVGVWVKSAVRGRAGHVDSSRALGLWGHPGGSRVIRHELPRILGVLYASPADVLDAASEYEGHTAIGLGNFM